MCGFFCLREVKRRAPAPHSAMPPKTAAELALERKFELLRKKKVGERGRERERGDEGRPMRFFLCFSLHASTLSLSHTHTQAAAAAGAGGGAGAAAGAAGA